MRGHAEPSRTVRRTEHGLTWANRGIGETNRPPCRERGTWGPVSFATDHTGWWPVSVITRRLLAAAEQFNCKATVPGSGERHTDYRKGTSQMTHTARAERPTPKKLSRAEREHIRANVTAWLDAQGIGSRAKAVRRVAVYLATLAAVWPDNTTADGDLYVNPSAPTIAAELDYTERSVRSALATLKDIGFWGAVRRTGRAAWRAVSGRVMRAVLPPSRREISSRRDVKSRHVAHEGTPYMSSIDQKSDRRVWSAGDGRRPWAAPTAPTPTPAPFTPAEEKPVAAPELRAMLRTGWKNLAKTAQPVA